MENSTENGTKYIFLNWQVFGILHDVPIAIVFNNVVDGYRHENAGHQGQDQSGYFEESPNK